MKITKQQLKQIIKEEISRILNEDATDVPEPGQEAAAQARQNQRDARKSREWKKHEAHRKAFEKGDGVLDKIEFLRTINIARRKDGILDKAKLAIERHYMSVCRMKNYDQGSWDLSFEAARALGDAKISPFPPGFEHDSSHSDRVVDLARAYIKGVFCPDRG